MPSDPENLMEPRMPETTRGFLVADEVKSEFPSLTIRYSLVQNTQYFDSVLFRASILY